MRQYHFRIPPGFILPGILGLLILAVVVSIGMVLFAVVISALVVIGIGSAIYRALFSTGDKKKYREHHIRFRTNRSGSVDDIPFTDYKEIETGSERKDSKE